MKIIDMDETSRLYLHRAYEMAKKASDDPRTHNGAVVVARDFVCSGANGLPYGVKPLPERLEPNNKKYWFIHAEMDAILRAGTQTRGATLYSPWCACCDCAKAIIASRILRVVAHKEMHDRTPEFWRESIEIGVQMLEEAGIEYVRVTGKVGGITNLMRGEVWEP